jgi:tetratricopeptide (TPR) repeat protein
MKPTNSFKRGVAKARREWQAGRYDKSLAEVSRLLREWPDNPQLLVMWADLIQLQDDDQGPSLDDARSAYRRAAELDNQSPGALIELGHFCYAIDDNAPAAAKAFDKAIDLCKRLLIEALIGRAKALDELGRGKEALASLAEAFTLQTRDGSARNGVGTDEILEQLRELAGAQ